MPADRFAFVIMYIATFLSGKESRDHFRSSAGRITKNGAWERWRSIAEGVSPLAETITVQKGDD